MASSYGQPRARKAAQQTWEVGQVVNVGFVKNLRIVDQLPNGAWMLKSETSGRCYRFEPHMGLYEVAGTSRCAD